MWPFDSFFRSRAVVLFHIDRHGLARGAYFHGDADVVVVDERDPHDRVYRMSSETPLEDIERRIAACSPKDGKSGEPRRAQVQQVEPERAAAGRWSFRFGNAAKT